MGGAKCAVCPGGARAIWVCLLDLGRGPGCRPRLTATLLLGANTGHDWFGDAEAPTSLPAEGSVKACLSLITLEEQRRTVFPRSLQEGVTR